MSETLSPSSRRTAKTVCQKCQRTVYVVVIDGERVMVDPELQAFVPYERTPAKLIGRRVHNELCLRYQAERDRIKAAAAARRKKPST